MEQLLPETLLDRLRALFVGSMAKTDDTLAQPPILSDQKDILVLPDPGKELDQMVVGDSVAAGIPDTDIALPAKPSDQIRTDGGPYPDIPVLLRVVLQAVELLHGLFQDDQLLLSPAEDRPDVRHEMEEPVHLDDGGGVDVDLVEIPQHLIQLLLICGVRALEAVQLVELTGNHLAEQVHQVGRHLLSVEPDGTDDGEDLLRGKVELARKVVKIGVRVQHRRTWGTPALSKKTCHGAQLLSFCRFFSIIAMTSSSGTDLAVASSRLYWFGRA